jgi:hypothetical protein
LSTGIKLQLTKQIMRSFIDLLFEHISSVLGTLLDVRVSFKLIWAHKLFVIGICESLSLNLTVHEYRNIES